VLKTSVPSTGPLYGLCSVSVGQALRREGCGTRGLRGRVQALPRWHFGNARHFVSGDRGLSEWLFTGTTADGTKVDVTGCDVFTFRGDKIAVKNSYLKSRTRWPLHLTLSPGRKRAGPRSWARP